MNQPTPQQKRAVEARGNVLVVAGAGAGKTRTVVDRCLHWLLDEKNPGSVDRILMVTFTEAAASEMRRRLRAGLERVNETSPSPHLAEQLALLETAHIGTLHGFCFHLVREYFYSLGLDPRLIVLSEERAQLLARQALDTVLQQSYSRQTPQAKAIQELIRLLGGDSDQPARELVLRLHHYARTLRDPDAWFAAHVARFQQTSPDQWRQWLMTELKHWRQFWLPILQTEPAENKFAGQCAIALAGLPLHPTREEFAAVLESVCAVGNACKGRWRQPIEKIFSEARFLRSVCVVDKTDPLADDWIWSAPAMLALLDLTRQFEAAYRTLRRDAGGVDFHDLEQLALQLLWDKEGHQPSAIALSWRRKLRLIFVDEYQDINGAQDAIIQALGREGAEANRFLVGDIKQSIYRFRLADPRIFLRYQSEWQTTAQVIPISENFRSHEGILNFVNALFATLMRQELGGIEYDEKARLRFGNAAQRGHLAAGSQSAPRVELHLRRLGGVEEPGDAAENEALTDTRKEARLVAQRLRDLKNPETAWSDMVVLLRAPRHKTEAYVKEFSRMGVPLTATRGGFYESLEARDLLSLLQSLDNPLQDLPLLAVLRSPLVGLTADDLADIRLAQRPAPFWTALNRWNDAHPRHERVNTFLNRFRAWRQMSRQAAVSQTLERVVEETGYADFTAAAGPGAPNISRLIYLARQFDNYQGQGLYRFLQFVRAQQEDGAQVEPAGQPLADAVRLMSIHQSKGLEFPIVVLADLAKGFNLEDARRRVILDEEFGLCPQVKPPGASQFYPSLPHWLAQRRQIRETLGEELRLLYVALTRAVDRLILFGAAREKTMTRKWPRAVEHGLGVAQILAGRSYMDWLGNWLTLNCGGQAPAASGGNSLLTWRIYDEEEVPMTPTMTDSANSRPSLQNALEMLPKARPVLEWRYPFEGATQRRAKTSVSELRRENPDGDEDEAEQWFGGFAFGSGKKGAGTLTAAEIGLAHHAFLEQIELTEVGSVGQLEAQTVRLRERGALSAEEAACLDFPAVADFWQSSVGRQLLAQAPYLHRELAFTARFSPVDLGKPDVAEDFVVVQGVIDLAVVMPGEIWVLDFKTNHFPREDLTAKVDFYRTQLTLYARAIGRIYHRPVTKRWLHFLTLRQTVELPDADTAAPAPF